MPFRKMFGLFGTFFRPPSVRLAKSVESLQ